MDYASLEPHCSVCDSSMKLSIELIEYLLSFEEEEDDFDAAIKRAIEVRDNGGKKMVPAPAVAFPVGLDFDQGALVFIAWCPGCKKIKLTSITPQELTELLKGGLS